jgi:hypothetical protein
MPIPKRVHQSDRPGTSPGESRWNQVWPAVIAATTMIVFIVFLVQVGLPMAVVMALATLVAAAILVTLVTGTTWLTRLRLLAPHLRGHR